MDGQRRGRRRVVGRGCRRWTQLWGPVSEALSCQQTGWVKAVQSPEVIHGPVAGLFPPPPSQPDASFEACFAKCCTGCHLRGHLCWQRPVPGHPLPTHLPRRCARKPCPGLDPEPLPGVGTALGLGDPRDPTLVPFHLPLLAGQALTLNTESTHTRHAGHPWHKTQAPRRTRSAHSHSFSCYFVGIPCLCSQTGGTPFRTWAGWWLRLTWLNKSLKCHFCSMTLPIYLHLYRGFSKTFSPVALVVKNSSANAGVIKDLGSILGSRRSPRLGHGNPLQYSCLENPTDREAWQIPWGLRELETAEWLSTHIQGLLALDLRSPASSWARPCWHTVESFWW